MRHSFSSGPVVMVLPSTARKMRTASILLVVGLLAAACVPLQAYGQCNTMRKPLRLHLHCPTAARVIAACPAALSVDGIAGCGRSVCHPSSPLTVLPVA